MSDAVATTSRNAPRVGGSFRLQSFKKLDGRSRVGRRLRKIKRELVEHVGGKPSVPQLLLIERLAVDIVRLELLDVEAIEGGISQHDSRVMHALRNSTRLGLRELGLAPRAPEAPTLASVIADIASKKARR